MQNQHYNKILHQNSSSSINNIVMIGGQQITITTNRQKQLSSRFQIFQNEELINKKPSRLNLTIMLNSSNNKDKTKGNKIEQEQNTLDQSKCSINFPCRSKKCCMFWVILLGIVALLTLSIGIGLIIAQNYQFYPLDQSSNLKPVQEDSQKEQKQQQKVEPIQPVKPEQPKYSPFSTNEYKIRLQFRKNTPIPSSLKDDRYDLIKSINEILDYNGFKEGKITKQYQRATRLLQVTHNVNIKGEFIFDHYDYYPSPQQKYKQLKRILQEQKMYYNQKYQMNKYIKDQIRFCIAIVSYNNARKTRLYLRNLDSIFQQDYQNYHVVYVDDVSTDGQPEYIEAYIKQNNIPQDKITLVKNKQKQGGSKNFINIGHNYCKMGEIMTLVDGDDALIGRQVFGMLNAFYQKHKPALTFGQLVQVSNFDRYNYRIGAGWSHKTQIDQVKNGQYRKSWFFFTCHLKTLYVDLFRQLKPEDFQYANGTYINHATDVVIMIPAVEMAQQRAIYVDEILYEYNKGPGMNEANLPQKQAHDYIRFKTPKKQRLDDLSFADNPITKHYQ